MKAEFLGIFVLLLRGIEFTLYTTLSCFMTASILGLAIAGLRRLSGEAVNIVLDLLVFLVRSIPVLVLLFLIYFGLPSLGLSISPFMAMNLSLGVIGGGYISEVFRGALLSVERSEIAAAEAMGFSRLQVIVYIEFPQMLRYAIPGLKNELTSILKNTPFAYTVGITEILGQAKALTASSQLGVNIYIAAGVIYFLLYWAVSFLITRLQRIYEIR